MSQSGLPRCCSRIIFTLRRFSTGCVFQSVPTLIRRFLFPCLAVLLPFGLRAAMSEVIVYSTLTEAGKKVTPPTSAMASCRLKLTLPMSLKS